MLPIDGKHDNRNAMQRPCEICGLSFMGGQHRRTCGSLFCQRAVYTINARARRRVPRVCICGVAFKPARNDAAFCSRARKQRAYRQRLAALISPAMRSP
jgi:hypothetical protein